MYVIDREIQNISDLIEACSDLKAHFGPNRDLWYRGHERADYHLQPGVHRDYNRDGELNLTANFRNYARLRHANCPPDVDYPGWLGLMQHYGLPTRLLDWTESPLVAAFFAVSYHVKDDADSYDADIWALCPQVLMGAFTPSNPSILPPDDPAIVGLIKAAFWDDSRLSSDEKIALNTILPWPPAESDARMMQQLSCFTIHGLAQPMDADSRFAPALARLRIPKSQRAAFQTELSLLGVRQHNLFPDLANLSDYLKNWLKPIYPKTTAP